MTKAAEQRRARGRPQRSESQRAEMRDQIEQAASKLFQSEGYGAVSIRRIAKEVGCSPMAIYAYFDNKVDLLRSLWAQVFDDLFQQVQLSVSAETSPKLRLQVLSIGYVQYWLENPERYRMVFMAEGVSQTDVSIFVDNPNIAKHFAQFFDLVSNVVEPDASGQMIKQKTDFLVSALHGIAHTQITMRGYDWADHNMLIKLAVRALSHRVS